MDLYSCSLRFIQSAHAKELYDYSIDVMSDLWDPKKALNAVLCYPDSEIDDILLDQTVFAGVGNIIKNEVLFLMKMQPTTHVKDIPLAKLKKLILAVQKFSQQFYEWRKIFELKKHYQVYRKSICPICKEKITKRWTGNRHRVSYFCSHCQSLKCAS